MDNHECLVCNRSFKTITALNGHKASRAHKDLENALLELSLNPIAAEPALMEIEDDRSKNLHDHPHFTYITNPEDYCPPIVKVKKLHHGLDLPDLKRATPGSAAVDLYAAVDGEVCIGTNERLSIPTGIAIELPEGFVAKVVPRSGLAFKHGISVINTPGVIDFDYFLEIKVCLVNHSRVKYWVERGDRIAQMLIERIEPVEFMHVDEISRNDRGGFGSTGR